MKPAGDRLHERFDRLRTVVDKWESRVMEMPELALEFFNRGDLQNIRSLLEERKMLLEKIRLFRAFIQKWENPGFQSILGVTKSEDEQGRKIFR
ncbi:hypothetical protein [Effusibacillus consociatus]|uniref:Dynein heavy chain linker domain-containing protein n=1 Tax=Effusibacillus consociatus TaxID=1117041 RepID=A0ABV9Q8C3_9BACL